MAQVKLFYGLYEFKPVPLMGEAVETVRDGTGGVLNLRHTLDFTGTLLVPSGNGTAFNAIFSEKERLRFALASGNQQLVMLNTAGVPVITGVYPRINNVAFTEGLWTDRVDYTFSLDFDEDRFDTGVSSFTETWNFEEAPDRTTVTASHQVSAVGVNTNPSGVNNAFLNAKDYVLSKAGYGAISPFFVAPSGAYSAYEELRSETSDIGTGSYSISENYILSSGNFIHTNTGSLSLDDAGVGTISLEGNIQGLGRGELAYQRALSAWSPSIKSRLPNFASGIYSELGGESILRTGNYKSFTVTRNSFAGLITYSVSYDDSDASNLPSGIQDFSISVVDQKPVRLFASFPIMERALGNVVQDISTSTEGRYEITGTAVGKAGFPFVSVLDYVQQQINNKRPFLINYQTLRLDSKQVTKDEQKNTVNFSIGWIYTQSLESVQDGTGLVIIN